MKTSSQEAHRIILVGGGVRSGKSSFAVELAAQLGERRTFIATARPSDDEMRARIERHRRDRLNAFETIEEPTDLERALVSVGPCDVVVVDCLTHWLANLLLRQDPVDDILEEVDGVSRVLAERRFHVVLVSNEVGMSIHPPTPLGRAFVEVSGWAHQRLARAADEIH